ncbi:MAG TPA: Rieske 2Fe-2S domain-containing protein [Thermoanaerobaculia bacterium]|nr:Rieske 2Fe-2S domain-containing protein [Thermoanaerobaculia bacterium]
MRETESGQAIGRRGLLLVGGWLGLETLSSSCAPEPEAAPKPGDVSIRLSEIEGGRRVVVVVLGNPVEVSRAENSVVARSLLCTHIGCVVKWREDLREYRCPCHEGRYDAAGEVIAGPPPRPLPTLPVRISGGRAYVGS